MARSIITDPLVPRSLTLLLYPGAGRLGPLSVHSVHSTPLLSKIADRPIADLGPLSDWLIPPPTHAASRARDLKPLVPKRPRIIKVTRDMLEDDEKNRAYDGDTRVRNSVDFTFDEPSRDY